ncbi:unnamed protein product, partial [Ascophyllum nodosum]
LFGGDNWNHPIQRGGEENPGNMASTRAAHREANNAYSNHDDRSPATTRSGSRAPSCTPSTESSRPQREDRRDRHIRGITSRGGMQDRNRSRSRQRGRRTRDPLRD